MWSHSSLESGWVIWWLMRFIPVRQSVLSLLIYSIHLERRWLDFFHLVIKPVCSWLCKLPPRINIQLVTAAITSTLVFLTGYVGSPQAVLCCNWTFYCQLTEDILRTQKAHMTAQFCNRMLVLTDICADLRATLCKNVRSKWNHHNTHFVPTNTPDLRMVE